MREYGDYVVNTEPGYDFSVLVDLEKLPETKGKDRVSLRAAPLRD